MNKKQFITVLKELKELEKKIGDVDLALKKLSPEFNGFYLDGVSFLIVNTLAIAVGDKDKWIDYWIWELDWGKNAKKDSVQVQGNPVPIKTMSDLYNLIKMK